MKLVEMTYLLTVGTPYVLMISTLYLFGFWSTYQINILEFIELTDIVKLAIHQLAYYAAFHVFGSIVSQIFLSPVLPPGGGYNYPEAKFVRKHWRWFMLIPVIVFVYFAWFSEHPWRWIYIAIVCGPTAGVVVAKSNMLSEIIQNEQYRFLVLFSLGCFPFLAFTVGTFDAQIKKNPTEAKYVRLNEDSGQYLIYIGKAGEYFFLYDPDKENLRAMRTSEIKMFYFYSETSENNNLGVTIKGRGHN